MVKKLTHLSSPGLCGFHIGDIWISAVPVHQHVSTQQLITSLGISLTSGRLELPLPDPLCGDNPPCGRRHREGERGREGLASNHSKDQSVFHPCPV